MAGKTVVVITKPVLGTVAPGDEEFGAEMLDRFLHALESRAGNLDALCFYTEGVRCVGEGSPHLLSLRFLAAQGARVIACRTCLDRYGLADRVAVGEVGGMDEIVSVMLSAGNVLTV